MTRQASGISERGQFRSGAYCPQVPGLVCRRDWHNDCHRRVSEDIAIERRRLRWPETRP